MKSAPNWYPANWRAAPLTIPRKGKGPDSTADSKEPVLNQLSESIERRLFLAAYRASNTAHWLRQPEHAGWRPLGRLIEYDTQMMTLDSDDGEPLCLLNLRSRRGHSYDRVTLKISVKKAGTIHQDTVTVRQLDRSPATVALPALPVKRGPSGRPHSRPFADVFIKLVSVIDHKGEEFVTGKKIADIFRPSFSDCRADQFVVRWGRCWNTVEIERQKQELRNRWFLRLVKSAGQLWRPLTLRRAAFRILASPPALALTFWSRNLFDGRGLRSALAERDASAVATRQRQPTSGRYAEVLSVAGLTRRY